jgi:REP element-mobilizing transposase RayT/AraC-like DNA-binding protein
MTRPLRIEFAGAFYHVTSRGDRKAAIFRDDRDRAAWLSTLELVCSRYNFTVYGFCQMTNHYHLIVETVEGNLAQGMRQLNGLYSQYFNRRHDVVGHLFQGRYKAILVQKESYLLELTRYVVLNPLRGGIVKSLDCWPWSSHVYVTGTSPVPAWLDAESLLRHFGSDRNAAREAYRCFVLAGIGQADPLKKTQHQLILGDETFTAKAQRGTAPTTLLAVSKTQRRAVSLSLEDYRDRYPNRNEAMARAYRSTAYTMEQIAAHFGVSSKTVSRAIRRIETDQSVSECRH